MAERQQSEALPVREGPEGIGGWLVLPMFGLVVTPILALIAMDDPDYIGLLQNWRAFTLPQNALIAAELVIGGVLNLTVPALLLFAMFKRWEVFPRWYVIWAAAMPLYMILDPLVARLVFPEALPALADAYDQETTRAITRSIWAAVIWVPYMMRSVRVANTFVN